MSSRLTFIMKSPVIALICLLLTWFNPVYGGPVSEIKKDETVHFFNTSAWLNQQTNQWHIPIHGWVYETEDSTVRKGLIVKALKTMYDLSVDTQSAKEFNQRVNLLLADNERNKSLVIRFANRTYALPPSTANGHFKSILKVDAKILSTADINHQLSYQAVLASNDHRTFEGRVNLIADTGLSIISDIDDTIKVSKVTDRKQLLNHTFFLPFKAVPGMAQQYHKWLGANGTLHYVSSSPWQLYPVLDDFLTKSGFPVADYALKSFRFKDSSLINLFASSLDTKPPQIIDILQRYPNRQFILVGDSGEKDPEVYAQIQRQYPQQIKSIFIRNVTNEKAENERFVTVFEHLKAEQWQLFKTADELRPYQLPL